MPVFRRGLPITFHEAFRLLSLATPHSQSAEMLFAELSLSRSIYAMTLSEATTYASAAAILAFATFSPAPAFAILRSTLIIYYFASFRCQLDISDRERRPTTSPFQLLHIDSHGCHIFIFRIRYSPLNFRHSQPADCHLVRQLLPD